jgi:nucleoside 2-deoxyribosyltransferase
MKIYLAGPDVFLPDAVEIGRKKAAICARYGVSGLYPLDNAVDLSAADASLTIFKGNEAMMEAADAIIANLTPFRGPSADAGTVYERRARQTVPRLQQRPRVIPRARCTPI